MHKCLAAIPGKSINLGEIVKKNSWKLTLKGFVHHDQVKGSKLRPNIFKTQLSTGELLCVDAVLDALNAK